MMAYNMIDFDRHSSWVDHEAWVKASIDFLIDGKRLAQEDPIPLTEQIQEEELGTLDRSLRHDQRERGTRAVVMASTDQSY